MPPHNPKMNEARSTPEGRVLPLEFKEQRSNWKALRKASGSGLRDGRDDKSKPTELVAGCRTTPLAKHRRVRRPPHEGPAVSVSMRRGQGTAAGGERLLGGKTLRPCMG